MDTDTQPTTDTDDAKVGQRHSARDRQDMQNLHDIAVRQGANCLKAVSETEDELRVKNYIVLFGGRDLEGLGSPRRNKDGSIGEYFQPDVDVESPYTKTGRLMVDWEHGQDPDDIGNDPDEILGYVDWSTAKRDEKGIEVERVLNRRAKYMEWLEVLIKEGLVGNSTQPVQKTVKKTQDGGIVKWQLARDSLTVTPMEPRMLTQNAVLALKNLNIEVTRPEVAIANKDIKQSVAKTTKEKQMELEEVKALFDDQKTTITALVEEKAKEAAKQAVDDVLDKLPEVKAAMNANVQVTKDEADREFKSVAEQMRAVKTFELNGHLDPRLNRIRDLDAKAALGSNEGVPSQGGFLLEPTLVADFLKPIHEEGPFTSLARKMPVGNNSNYGWINGIDETSRADGSRWGGVRGYWLAEGDSKTASQPKFRRINWELHKLAVIQYATDELLADAAQMNAVIRMSSMEELSFKVNDALIRGSGAGMPKGILNGGALASAVRTNANNIDHDDVLRMINLLLPSSYANAVWFASPDVQPEIDALNFTAGTTGILSPYVTYTANGVTLLRGRPVVYNEFNPTLGSVGDLLLADMNDYLMWEKAVEAASSIHVQFLTDQTVFRFVYRVDGQPATYTTLTPYQGSTGRSPYVALAATT